VQDSKSQSKHFICLEQMTQIGSGKTAANRTAAAFADGTAVCGVFFIQDIDISQKICYYT